MTDLDIAVEEIRRESLTEPIERLGRMIEIRYVEDTIKGLFAEGLVSGSTHTCQGQEAVSVGIAAATRPTDVLCCTYRGHGHALALGMTPRAVLAEILGRAAGCVGGIGGSMHLSSKRIGLMPTMAIVGAGIPIAAGAAWTAQLTGTDAVAVSIFGDGATNIGAFHEGLNLAAIWSLPAVFVCENNLYGEYSRIDATTAGVDIAGRARAYGIPGEAVDGQDLSAVMDAVGRAVARARDGGGPTLLEMRTYRYSGHSRSDQATYRPAGELDEWLARDPLVLDERRLIESATTTAVAIEELRRTTALAVEEAMAEAKASPAPRAAEMFEHVLGPGRTRPE